MKIVHAARLALLSFSVLAFAQLPAPAQRPQPPAAAHPSTLAQRIDTLIAQDPRSMHALWGIEIADAATGQSLYEQNPDRLFVPASNTKLFTTATTMALVGPDYRFHTSVETKAMPDKFGRIAGDVILVGRGDPNLSARVLPYNIRTELEPPRSKHLDDLAEQVVRSGVKYIDGDIVGDDTFFLFERYGEAWSQDDLMWWYGAPLSALTLNDNTVVLNMLPGATAGAPAMLALDPYRDLFEIENRTVTTAPGTKRNLGLEREPGSSRLVVWGTIPLEDRGQVEELAIDDPALANAQLFRSMLVSRGVQVLGKARALHKDPSDFAPTTAEQRYILDNTTPAPQPPRVELAYHDSAPLGDDIRVANKVSQNLHVEIMLRLLGKLKGPSASISGGGEVVRNFLIGAGLDPSEFVFFDGSGMSRQNLVTPRAVTKLLRYISNQPWGSRFRDTLPVAAVDGSLRLRFAGTKAVGKLSAKTGTLGGVNALSGYATTASGRTVVFSILVNHHQMGSAKAQEIIDEIGNAIVQSL